MGCTSNANGGESVKEDGVGDGVKCSGKVQEDEN